MTDELRERDLDSFFRAPFEAYGAGSPFVSPLRSDLRRFLDPGRNPTFARAGDITYFSLVRDGKPIGRIVAQVHRAANHRHQLARSQFGFFDCIDDLAAARTLLGAAEAFGLRHGANEIAGNFNLTGNHAIGIVTDGFENQPFIEQIYNPPHVPKLLEALGYQRFFPMTTHELAVDLEAGSGVLGDKQRALADRGFRVEALTRRSVRAGLRDCRALLNLAFDANPLFVPMSEEEFLFYAKDLTWVIDPRITVLAYDGPTAVGALVCVPDLNPLFRRVGSRIGPRAVLEYFRYRRSCRRAVAIFYAVHPAYHNRGVNGLMLHAIIGALARAGYTHLGGTWIADANPASLRQIEKLGARPYHRLHLYGRSLRHGAHPTA